MTATRGLFVRQTGTAPNAIGTTPLEARLAIAGLLAEQSPGVPRTGLLFQSNPNLVTASTTDMSYNISSCNPAINRAVNEGLYLFTLTGTTNVTTDNAPSTGSRYDLVYVRQHDPDKGDADNLPEVGVVRGTSSTGTPTKPYSSVPAGGYVVAEAQIFSGTTSTSGGTNVITQVWKHTAARGAHIPVINQTDRDGITAFNGLAVTRLDLNGQQQVYGAGAWRSPNLAADFANGTSLPMVKSGTVLVNTDANGWAGYVFPTPFASTMTSCTVTECTLHTVFGAIIVKYDFDTSDKTRFRVYLYAANGAALANATGVRLSYIATGY